MNAKQALLAGMVLALPTLAAAQPIEGLYVGAGIGANFPNAQPNNGFSPSGGGVLGDSPGAHFNTGWLGVGSVGYGFGNGLRAELQTDFYRNSVNQFTGTSSSGGFENKVGAMANVLYDFDLSHWDVLSVMPYVGLGVGYQHSQYQNVFAGEPAGQLQVNSGANGFAYQGIVGLAFPIASVAGLAATVEYRIMDMPLQRNYNATFVTPAGVTGGIQRMGAEVNQSMLVGLRYAFNAAPPPPPPAPAPAPVAAPAPAPSRTYLVFFDWDKADLTDRARQIIGEAAQNSTRVQLTRIEVNGYTDASGTPQYNQKLSVRRAQNVAAELVRDGVPQQVIAIQGFGETHPLVPTADGVREPQNRRVEIILH